MKAESYTLARATERYTPLALRASTVAAVLAGVCVAACARRPQEAAPEAPLVSANPAPQTNVGPTVFEDRAAAAGLDFTHFNGMTGRYLFPEVMGAGVALVDVDRDGDLDAYLVQGAFLEPGEGAAAPLVEPPAGPLVDRLFLNRSRSPANCASTTSPRSQVSGRPATAWV